jgi:type IV/VI secretion system ImpK/VasF family protein
MIDQMIDTAKKTNLTATKAQELKSSILGQLNYLRDNLQGALEDGYIALILFALAASLDEEIQPIILNSEALHWSPLTRDVSGDFNAGDDFYQRIDYIIENPKTPLIVYEVFYYALKRGFKGTHRNSKVQIVKYLELLSSQIPEEPQQAHPETETLRRPLGRIKYKSIYYAASCAAIILCFVCLQIYSNW